MLQIETCTPTHCFIEHYILVHHHREESCKTYFHWHSNFSVRAFPFVSLSIQKHAYPVWCRVKSADNPSKKQTVTSFLL